MTKILPSTSLPNSADTVVNHKENVSTVSSVIMPPKLPIQDYLTKAEYLSLYKNVPSDDLGYESKNALRQALGIIIHKSNVQLLDIMVSRGFNINYTLRRGQNLVSESIYQSSGPVFTYLLSHAADINYGNPDKHPFHAILEKEYYNWIEPLLKAGANPNVKIGEVYFHQMISRLEEFPEIFQLLVNHNFDMNLIHEPNDYKQTLVQSLLNYREHSKDRLRMAIDNLTHSQNCDKVIQEIGVYVGENSWYKHSKELDWVAPYMLIKKEQLLLQENVAPPSADNGPNRKTLKI